jgi:hypothetical protein
MKLGDFLLLLYRLQRKTFPQKLHFIIPVSVTFLNTTKIKAQFSLFQYLSFITFQHLKCIQDSQWLKVIELFKSTSAFLWQNVLPGGKKFGWPPWQPSPGQCPPARDLAGTRILDKWI